MLCVQRAPPTAKVDISLLLKPKDEESSPPTSSRSLSVPAQTPGTSASTATSTSAASIPTKRPLQDPPTTQSPAKKQSKWSEEEDRLIIDLRGSGMKWEDISKKLPGRSAISCRLHYQNYLERRSEWDEDRKNKLARLYERFKAEMWAKVAEEMAIPWRAAEAMHWQLGEHEMAKRAGVTPFTLSNSSTVEKPSKGYRAPASQFGPRLRRDSQAQSPPQQLPSVAELTAGLPAYAPHLADPYAVSRTPFSSPPDPHQNTLGSRRGM